MSEIKCWSFTAGENDPYAKGKKRKAQEMAAREIRHTDGLLGIYPSSNHASLMLYISEDAAKQAMKTLRALGIQCSDSISECSVNREIFGMEEN